MADCDSDNDGDPIRPAAVRLTDSGALKSIEPATNSMDLKVPVKMFDNPAGKYFLGDMAVHSFSCIGIQYDEKRLRCIDERSGEYKMALRTLLEQAKQAQSRKPLDIDNQSFICFDADELDIRSAAAVVQIFTGEGLPDGVEKYERVVYGKSDDGKCQARWSRLKALTLEGVLEPEDATAELDVPPYHSSVKFQISLQRDPTTLRELVRVAATNRGSSASNKASAAVNAILRTECTTTDNDTVVLGNRFFKCSADATIRGIEVRNGITRSMYLANGDVMLAEKGCQQLFFSATSVARFMEAHCGPAAVSGDSTVSEHLTRVLKGVKVELLGPMHKSIKTIHNIEDRTPEQQTMPGASGKTEVRVAHYYASQNYNITSPKLPCINVGSAKRPFYVPANFCTILPDQCFKIQDDPTLQREIATLRVLTRSGAATTQSGPEKSNDGSKASTSELKSRAYFHSSKCKNWQTSRMHTAQIILVEAGTVPFESGAWTQFQNVLRSMSKRERYDGETDSPDSSKRGPIASVSDKVLRLGYTVDEKNVQEEWANEVGDAIEKLDRHADDQNLNVVLLFGVLHGKHRPAIFRLMKKVCNTNGIGVQSIGINLTTLRNKISQDPSSALQRYCGQIFHKIFARTPLLGSLRSPQTLASRSEDLAIALHVTRYTTKEQQDTMYLVAFVSRELKRVGQYRTTVEKLIKPDGIHSSLCDLLQAHILKHGYAEDRGPSRVLLFRSGCQLPDEEMTSSGRALPTENKQSGFGMPKDVEPLAFTPPDRRVLPKFQDHDEDEEVDEQSAEDSKRDGLVSPTPVTRTQASIKPTPSVDGINRECQLLTSALQATQGFSDTTVCPVQVNEETAYDLQLSKGGMANHVKEFHEENRKLSRPPKAMFLVERPECIDVSGRQCTVYVHNAAQDAKTLIKLKTLDALPPAGRRDSVNPQTSRIALLNPKRRMPGSRIASFDGKPNSNAAQFSHRLPGPDTAEAANAQHYFQVDAEGADILARVFHDSHLGIHGCKWPVPTYLARRAIGWMITHADMVDETNADGSPARNKNGSTKRHSIFPKIHPNRENTLWYL